jgi:hypothetical protein
MFIERKVLKKIRNYKAVETAKEIDYAEDGSAIINVGLKHVDDFYNPVCYKTYEMINPEVLHFIDDNQKGIPADKNLNIDISVERRTTNDEKKRIRDTVKRHAAEEVVALKKRLNNNLISGLAFFVLGIVLLLVGMLFDGESSSSVIVYTIVIIAWVFEWDAIEMLVFDRHNLKQRLIRKFNLLNAKVHVRQYSKAIIREYEIELDDEEKKEENNLEAEKKE